MTVRAGVSICAAAWLAASGAEAHHSLAGYDQTRTVRFDAVVAGFQFTQPHPILSVSSGGATWRLEMDNLYELQAVGMTRDTLKPGDRVQLAGDQDRTRAHALYLRRLDRAADGFHYEQVGGTPRVRFGPGR